MRLKHSRLGMLCVEFQFTHPGRGATKLTQLIYDCFGVSIHAPREGCDVRVLVLSVPASVVSIHAPREGCDLNEEPRRRGATRFQFTHPGRGATSKLVLILRAKARFNSRTPGGVRRTTSAAFSSSRMFQFTHPGRGATEALYQMLSIRAVSIHAPREGCDCK